MTAAPAKIAIYGHIAARLRAEIEKRNMTVRQFNRLLGLEPGNTMIYAWLGCRSSPNPVHRRKLAQVLDIPEAELMVRSNESVPLSLPAVIEPRAPRPVDVLTFAVDNQGQARIRLDVSLPVDKAAPLFRVLLDAGLVMKGEAE